MKLHINWWLKPLKGFKCVNIFIYFVLMTYLSWEFKIIAFLL